MNPAPRKTEKKNKFGAYPNAPVTTGDSAHPGPAVRLKNECLVVPCGLPERSGPAASLVRAAARLPGHCPICARRANWRCEGRRCGPEEE
ncbi:hypothetical protein NDU88_002130 [Pleurodeles waltl]|uniref:Uncharacterized protein n=1 Tax=Pleurodeles waltl TaxID=8319 RepID=A0AAV7LBL1_PLEWA|nr:hypothetical protein NDU88_002130 [Pleurodeles waltl]